MTLYEDVGQCLKRLLLLDPYYALFMISLDKQETTSVPTLAVATNGVDIKLLINPNFWFKLSPEEKFGVCIHEVLHLCYMHLFTAEAYPNSKLDNIACDAEINQYIPTKYLPEGGITLKALEDQYRITLAEKMGRDHYYKELRDKIPEDHDLGNNEHFWDAFEQLSEADKQVIMNQVGALMEQTADAVSKSQGTVPGNIAGLIQLRKIPARFDWRSHMRRWAGNSNEVYLKPSRFKPNPYFPGTPMNKIKLKKHILCAIDTSGSVSTEELHEFMSEIHNLWKFGHSVTILCADTTLYPAYVYKGESTIKIHGRGGTFFTPILEYFNEKPEYGALVYFTDGYAELPPNAVRPMLWVISSNGSPNAIQSHNGKKLIIEK